MSGYITGRASIDGIRIHNPHAADEIAFTGLALPSGSTIRSGVELWRAADMAERKKNGEYRRNGGHCPILASHVDLALPYGTTEAQAQKVIDQVCRHLVDVHQIGVEYAVHRRHGRIDHVHLLWSTRTVGPDGLGTKARSLNAIAQRQSGNDRPSAMEKIREIASKAIRDSCGIDWDHRSFKRRGIDRIAEPKLDQKQLREQRRRLAKLGISEPTQVERDLTLLRQKRASNSKPALIPDQGVRRLPHKSILEFALHMDKQWNSEIDKTIPMREALKYEVTRTEEHTAIPKPKPSEEDDDSWATNLIERHPGYKIEEQSLRDASSWRWVAKIEEPDFDTNAIRPIDPHDDCGEDLEFARTAIYAHTNRKEKLCDYAILLLAMLWKRTVWYVIWRLRCYETYLKQENHLHKFLEHPHLSGNELRAKMNGISHARIKQTQSEAARNIAPVMQVRRGREGRGMLD